MRCARISPSSSGELYMKKGEAEWEVEQPVKRMVVSRSRRVAFRGVAWEVVLRPGCGINMLSSHCICNIH